MLKKRELHESKELYQIVAQPSVYPYVRHQAKSADEFWFMTRQIMEEEENGKTISRTITGDWGQLIGTISLFDIQDGAGFLATWISEEFQGKGYNQKAKLAFFSEIFFELNINTVFMKVKSENKRSQRAVEKLGYAINAKETNPSLFAQINEGVQKYELYKIDKDFFYLFTASLKDETEQAM